MREIQCLGTLIFSCWSVDGKMAVESSLKASKALGAERIMMSDLEAYKDKFSDSGKRILETAINESRRRDQNYISVEHILHALTLEEPEL
ncbi:MAG: Clp protease N-terminal domain-containing protein, partial [Pyrinomonadaceae bacterium]